jgi:hypothetical protein
VPHDSTLDRTRFKQHFSLSAGALAPFRADNHTRVRGNEAALIAQVRSL